MVESSVQEQSLKVERPQSESNGLEASLTPESLQTESKEAAQGCWRPEVQHMSSNELEQHWNWRQEGCCTLGCSQATAISEQPAMAINTTVTTRARFICAWVIMPFCIPRSGPMRSSLSLPFTASP